MMKLTDSIIHWDDKYDELYIKCGYSDYKELKQQILDNQEKAVKYDDLMKANSEIVKQNISHMKIHQKNEQLTQQIHDLEEAMDYEPDLLERLELTEENKQLKSDYLKLEKQCAIERETANWLDYTCEDYEKQIKELKEIVEKINQEELGIFVQSDGNMATNEFRQNMYELKELLATKEER